MLVVLLAITLFVFFVVDILRYLFMRETASWMTFMAYMYRQSCVAYRQFCYVVHKQVYDTVLMLSMLCLMLGRSINHNLEMLSMHILYLQEKA